VWIHQVEECESIFDGIKMAYHSARKGAEPDLPVVCQGQAKGITTPTAAPTTAPTATPTPLPATIPLGATIVQMIENPPGHYIFQPASITIKAGSVIVWIDMSDAPHTVSSDPGDTISFNTTSNVTQDHTFALVFTAPGTLKIH
jgi:plastocyanin